MEAAGSGALKPWLVRGVTTSSAATQIVPESRGINFVMGVSTDDETVGDRAWGSPLRAVDVAQRKAWRSLLSTI